MTVGLMAAGDEPARAMVVAGAVLVLWALLNLGGIFEHRRWALPSELLRLPATAAALATRLPDAPWRLPALAGLALAVVASWLCLLAYRRQFDGVPQPPGRLIGRPDARPGSSEHLSSVEAVTVPIGDGGGP